MGPIAQRVAPLCLGSMLILSRGNAATLRPGAVRLESPPPRRGRWTEAVPNARASTPLGRRPRWRLRRPRGLRLRRRLRRGDATAMATECRVFNLQRPSVRPLNLSSTRQPSTRQRLPSLPFAGEPSRPLRCRSLREGNLLARVRSWQWPEEWTLGRVAGGLRGYHFPSDQRCPGTRLLISARFFAPADSACRAQGESARA